MKNMSRTAKIVLLLAVVPPLILVFAALGGAVVQQLWNWLMPQIFGAREVTFWQALGLLALCRILFGGLGGHSHSGSRIRRRVEERVNARLDALTPEERERVRERMRDRCGFGPRPDQGAKAPTDKE